MEKERRRRLPKPPAPLPPGPLVPPKPVEIPDNPHTSDHYGITPHNPDTSFAKRGTTMF